MKSLVLVPALMALNTLPGAGDDTYRKAAIEAARWIASSAIRTGNGIVWPADPLDPKSVNTTLYNGSAGVILFLLEAHRVLGDKSYLDDARSGADSLLASLSTVKEPGLYTGLAGIGFTLQETFKATGQVRYRDGALKCARLLRESAVKSGSGIDWNDTTDIIRGSAGVGLFLLYAAREFNEPAFRESARLTGARLIELGRPEASGLKWAMNPTFKRLMPNFSHGTAGIAYFLATLYSETGGKEFLAAAERGARYLQAQAETGGEICLVFHNEPDGRDLYYLGWCHGPAGTARLFYRLYLATGSEAWLEWVKRSARGVLRSGIPDRQTPGFWNNVSQCCGSAGVAEFFLDLHRVTRDREYLDFAKRMTAQLLGRASREDTGMKWVQAEHRVRPELLVAQTGYMQGAAGIGMWLLHLDSFLNGKEKRITFPDSPF